MYSTENSWYINVFCRTKAASLYFSKFYRNRQQLFFRSASSGCEKRAYRGGAARENFYLQKFAKLPRGSGGGNQGGSRCNMGVLKTPVPFLGGFGAVPVFI
jgi:hypothetical protein